MDNAGHILPFWHFLGNLQEPPLSPPPIRPFKCVLSNYRILNKKFGQNQPWSCKKKKKKKQKQKQKQKNTNVFGDLPGPQNNTGCCWHQTILMDYPKNCGSRHGPGIPLLHGHPWVSLPVVRLGFAHQDGGTNLLPPRRGKSPKQGGAPDSGACPEFRRRISSLTKCPQPQWLTLTIGCRNFPKHGQKLGELGWPGTDRPYT